MQVKISKKCIGDACPVFIIAEAGINHNGNLKMAKKLIAEASNSGADAIKFQTFTAKDLASENSKYFKIFKKLEFNSEDFGELSDYSKSQGIIFCSTPFSEEAIDVLFRLNVPFYKIASGDLTDIPLIEYAASKKKPMLISTGMADFQEIRTAINSIRKQGNDKIVILHSVSAYPTPPEQTNLRVIQVLKKKFPYPVGFSDNGPGLLVPITAILMGAHVIEKHFTLNRKLKGPDHSFSANPEQLSQLVEKSRLIKKILGDGKKRCQPAELDNKVQARRSLIANITIKKGTKIKNEMIGIKRPATGIPPARFHKIIGKFARRNIKKHESLKWNDIK